jgi:hypothetical protein
MASVILFELACLIGDRLPDFDPLWLANAGLRHIGKIFDALVPFPLRPPGAHIGDREPASGAAGTIPSGTISAPAIKTTKACHVSARREMVAQRDLNPCLSRVTLSPTLSPGCV